MNDDRKRVLKMVETGKLSVEEAEELLETMETPPAKKTAVRSSARFIKIMVNEEGEEKVDISIPFSLARTALKFIPESAKDDLKEQQINLDELLQAVEDGLEGPQNLVNINEGDTRIVIRVE